MNKNSNGDLTHFEIGVSDAKKAQNFFGQLLGWTLEPMPGDNAAVRTPSMRGGIHGEDPDNCIVAYFAVEDIEEAVRKVRELGGEASEPSPDEPGWGRFSQCTDDQGVKFGLQSRAEITSVRILV